MYYLAASCRFLRLTLLFGHWCIDLAVLAYSSLGGEAGLLQASQRETCRRDASSYPRWSAGSQERKAQRGKALRIDQPRGYNTYWRRRQIEERPRRLTSFKPSSLSP